MAEINENKRLHPLRLIIALILGIILLAIAIVMYRDSHSSAHNPTQSTEQMNPNAKENIAPSGSVNKGSNPSQATTPSPNGTNGNRMSSQ